MAAHDNLGCHVKEGLSGSIQPSSSGKRSAAAMAAALASAVLASAAEGLNRFDDPAAGPMAKKNRLDHSDESAANAKPEGANGDGHGDRPRLPSPIDVRETPTTTTGWCSQAKIQASQTKDSNASRVKTLPPTLRGITDAARVLQASKSLISVGKENRDGGKPTASSSAAALPLLVSFPTESAYAMACCVKTASSRSIRKLTSRSDSQGSFGSFSSFNDGLDSSHHDSALPKDFIHPPNPSLEWMLSCSGDSSMAPTLFVMDKLHALSFCHFTKPKTFAIRPPSVNANCSGRNALTPMTPSRQNTPPIAGSTPSKTPEAPFTPKSAKVSSPANTVSPSTPNTNRVLAANFSESREAFLRLASQFWPGPVAFHVQARVLGGTDEARHLPNKKSCSSASTTSLPSLPSMQDLASVGSLAPSCNGVGGVPVLPPSVLIPASHLVESKGDEGSERYFVGMQCPSHPLPRKILNEVYCGPATSNASHSAMSHSPSSNSLSSMDDGEAKSAPLKAAAGRNGRARTNVAVIGCMVPGSESVANGDVTSSNSVSASSNNAATTAANANEALCTKFTSLDNNGRVFLVDGEDQRESFTVPTCQYGSYPVSLTIDGENRTIYLLRHGPSPNGEKSAGDTAKHNIVSQDSVYRALLKPASLRSGSFNLGGRPSSPKAAQEVKGDSTSIDRVTTAVLSRWKVHEIAVGSRVSKRSD